MDDLKISQYLSLCDLITEHKAVLTPRQADALVGMQRRLKKGICDELTCKRIDGLFKTVLRKKK